MNIKYLASTLLGALALFSSCAGSGGSSSAASGSSSGPDARASNVMISTVGDAGLFALRSEWSELRLVNAAGKLSPNLLQGDTTVELVGLSEQTRWMGQAQLPVDTYTEMEVRFASTQVVAVDGNGQESQGQLTSDTWTIPFEVPLLLAGPGAELVHLEIDLGGSLSTDPTRLPTPGFDFDLDAVVSLGTSTPMAEVRGTLRGLEIANQILDLDAESFGGLTLGNMRVEWNDSTNLFDDDGSRFIDPNSFFNSLNQDNSVLRVQGEMQSGGHLSAMRMEIVDQIVVSIDPPYELDGLVMASDLAAQTFSVLVREVHGDAMGLQYDPLSPNVIHFRYVDQLQFEGVFGAMADVSELSVGRHVSVTFPRSRPLPYIATRVRLFSEYTCISGTISMLSDMNSRLTLRASDDCALWESDGDDDDDDDEYRDDDDDDDFKGSLDVDLGSAELLLNLRGRPALRAGQLDTGLRVRVCGVLGGTRSQPVLNAFQVFVHPGHLIKGEVELTDPRSSSFELSSAMIVQPFGDQVTGTPLEIKLNNRARYLQDAKSEGELFRLFNGLQDDQLLEVKIKGIGAGTPEAISAFEVKAKVKRRK